MSGCVLLRFIIPGWVMWCLGRQCLVLNADVSSNAASRLCVLSWGQKRAFLWLTVSLRCEFTRRADTTHTSLCDQRALSCTECQTGRSGRHTHMLKNNNRHTYRMSHARQFLCKHVHHSTPTHAVCKSTSINISCLYIHHDRQQYLYFWINSDTHKMEYKEKS